MAKVLISGGTGLVGMRLTSLLIAKGYDIHILSRTKEGIENGIQYFKWSPHKGQIDGAALNVNHVIHLAGAGVADKKWTTERKREILDSRVLSTRLIRDQLLETGHRPKSIVCASAVGYYGDRDSEILNEDSGLGKGFLADTCKEWESETSALGQAVQTPTAILRIGIVLSAKGGALPKLALPVKFGIGAYLGNGKQYYPWIHIDDLCELIIYAMEKPLAGVYNATAPHPETNKDLVKKIAKALNRPFLPAPGPSLIIKGLMGEQAEMLLNSQRASSEKIESSGFQFKFRELDEALRDIFSRKI